MPHFNFMNINKSSCGFTYYRYYIKGIHSGSGNYIPIFAINIPYTYASVREEQINIHGIMLSDFGIENNAEVFWKYVPKGGIPTSFLEIYEDDFFTISTPNTTDLSCSFKASDGTNLGNTRTSVVYDVSENVIPIFGIVVITSDNEVIYGSGSIAASHYDFLYCYAIQGNNSIDIIHKPISEKNKGIAVYPPLSVTVDAQSNTASFKKRIHELLKISRIIDSKDPDPNIDDSDGDKNRTPTDDIGGNTIGDDDLPTLSVMDTGLVTLYNPTVGQLQALGHFLWSDAFSVDTFKKLFADPFDTLLGLSILPVTPKVSGSHNIYFGNIDSGVSCNVVANQFLKVDIGTLTLNETYASAFDYAPSTQVDIYLPFIGSHGLNTNDVMGSTLHLIYKFDLLSGGCIAELFINHTSQGNKGKGMKYNRNMGLAYTFSGQCSCSIPLTSNNYNGMIQGLIQSIGTIGGIGASVATGNPALGIASVATSAATIGLQANTPTVQRSGNIGSSNALLSCLTPYLSVQRAHVCKPGHFYSKRGIPSQVYVGNISSVGSGNYFQIADCVDLHANGASDTELSEIKSILTSGAVW